VLKKTRHKLRLLVLLISDEWESSATLKSGTLLEAYNLRDDLFVSFRSATVRFKCLTLSTRAATLNVTMRFAAYFPDIA
jgi:hypothetical protein